jgi:hypothetical protein
MENDAPWLPGYGRVCPQMVKWATRAKMRAQACYQIFNLHEKKWLSMLPWALVKNFENDFVSQNAGIKLTLLASSAIFVGDKRHCFLFLIFRQALGSGRIPNRPLAAGRLERISLCLNVSVYVTDFISF